MKWFCFIVCVLKFAYSNGFKLLLRLNVVLPFVVVVMRRFVIL